MVPCERSPNFWARAVWPPTFSHARRRASRCGFESRFMPYLTHKSLSQSTPEPLKVCVNVDHLGKKPITEPSAFWIRLTECWKQNHLPTTQNGIATRLGMSQGSTRRWFTGEGLPETETLKDLAARGHVTIDWLLTSQLPRAPIKPGSPLYELLEIWYSLDEILRERILHAAMAEKALAQSLKIAPEAPNDASLRPSGS